MRTPAKTAALVFGLGVGATIGPSLGPAAFWSGVGLAALGVALSLVGKSESDLVEDAQVDGDATAADRAAAPGPRGRTRQRPILSGLGTRVEQILALAEEQAADHRAEARAEAERIVAGARQEAEAILNRAREEAAGTIDPREDQSSPPTAPAPDEGPSRTQTA